MTETATQVELDGQYRALREEAGFLARDRGALLVSGPDAAEYLQGQLTNDIEALEPEQGCYAALLDRKGHLRPTCACCASRTDELWLDLEPGRRGRRCKHLAPTASAARSRSRTSTDRWAIASLIGPRGRRARGLRGPRSRARSALPQWDGTEVLGVATDVGVDLIARPRMRSAWRALLAAAGAAG